MTTEQAAQHLSGIIELLYSNQLWRIAQRQTYSVSASVGKFSAAPDSSALDSLREFEAAVRAHRGALRQARGRSRREAPRTLGEVAESGLAFAQRPSLAIRGVVEDAEDVRGQAVVELLALRGDAIPCSRCPRRFDMRAFRAEVREVIESPEQLRALETCAQLLQWACPTVWYALGLRPPYCADASLPYGRDADIVQKDGRRIPVVCRALALARQYSRRSAIRVLYHKAKASPTDQLDGRARNTTEEEVVARIAMEEALERLQAEAPSRRRRRAFTAIASCVAELGRAPDSAELSRTLGISLRAAQRHLRAWKAEAIAVSN